MARYGGLLDACALVPIVLADTVLRIAERGLYRPFWSSPILKEMAYAIRKVHPDIDPALIERRVAAMEATFEDALVTGWEPLVDGIMLPDANDRHVLAAAVRGGAQAIVTFNLSDFPADTTEPLGVTAIHPDEFLLDQLDLAPTVVLDVLREQAADTRHPPLDVFDVVGRLDRAGVREFAAEVGRLL